MTLRPAPMTAGGMIVVIVVPAAFPWFNTQRYWQDRSLELREQIALMDEEPLSPS